MLGYLSREASLADGFVAAMKRRKRKRGPREANRLEQPTQTEAPSVDLSEPAPPEPVSPPSSQNSEPVPAPDPAPTTAADRRSHPRYEFTAAVEVTVVASGARFETRLRDLSQQGCYADTTDPLPLGTNASVRITKGAQLVEARARVVYSRAGKGMGLAFLAIGPEHIATLENWLADSRETSWLAANRRRSQRVLMRVPVRVSGRDRLGLPFEEETQTLAISAHGALISLSTEIQVRKGQPVAMVNSQTKAALECVIAHIGKSLGDSPRQVGMEFTLPNPTFWHVTFPPKDWTPRHPEAKSPSGRTAAKKD